MGEVQEFFYGISEARNETPPAPAINVEGESQVAPLQGGMES